MKRLLTMSLMLFIAWAVPATPAQAERYAPRVGERHADFTLPAVSDGKPVSLAQYRGKKLLLIHFASW